MELQENDILVFKSGTKREYTTKDKWMFENFYDKELNCLTNDKFTIVKILRPHYEVVFTRETKTLKKERGKYEL